MKIQLNDFIGEVSNSHQPSSNSGQIIRNFDVHTKPGVLTLRKGYTLRYPHPTDSRISDIEYVSFKNYYDKSQTTAAEITVQICKGTVKSDFTEQTIKIPIIFVRPYWTGAYWLDEWLWLNETNLTKISAAPDNTYQTKMSVLGINFGSLKQWSIINLTKNRTVVEEIISSKVSGASTEINISNFNSQWELNDEVIIQRNYIPLKYLEQMYQVQKQDIAVAKINSEMRLSFGSYENRVVMAIATKKTVLQLSGYSYTNVDQALTDSLDTFRKLERMVLEQYTVLDPGNNYDISIDTSDGGAFPAGEKFFKMTALIDGISEVLVCEKTINDAGAKRYIPKPYVRYAAMSKRVTEFRIYFSADGFTWNHYKNFTVRSTTLSKPTITLDNQGFLVFASPAGTNFYIESSAASTVTDSAYLGSWKNGIPLYTYDVLSAEAGDGGTFFLRLKNTRVVGLDSNAEIHLTLPEALKANSDYDISFKLRVDITHTITMPLKFTLAYTDPVTGLPGYAASNSEQYLNLGTWATYSFTLHTLSTIESAYEFQFKISCQLLGGQSYIDVDDFTISEKTFQAIDDSYVLGANITAQMGYIPTFNLVKSWDDSLVFNGRVHVLNPFVEKRYDNMIYKSQIGPTTYQWDAIVSEGFINVERHKGEISIGFALLQNLNILLIKDVSAEEINPETGQTTEIGDGIGGVARLGIVSSRNVITYPGKDDLIILNSTSGNVEQLPTEKTVRDKYSAIIDKSGIIAIRDLFNTYRFVANDPESGLEYLLTSRGFVENVKSHFPIAYDLGVSNLIWFMTAQGDIYSFAYQVDDFVGYADKYGDYRAGW